MFGGIVCGCTCHIHGHTIIMGSFAVKHTERGPVGPSVVLALAVGKGAGLGVGDAVGTSVGAEVGETGKRTMIRLLIAMETESTYGNMI